MNTEQVLTPTEQKLNEDMKVAMRAKEEGKVRLTIIRMVIAEIKNAKIDLRTRNEDMTEDKVITVVNKMLKDIKETLENLLKVGTNVSEIEKHQEWVQVLETYLPKQLTEVELRELVTKIVQENGFSGKKDLRNIMPILSPQVKGRVDGKLVNQVVTEILG